MSETETTTTPKPPAPRKPPASAKKPQDRKPPEPPKAKVTQTDDGRDIELEGVKVHVLNEALDDFELLDMMGRAEATQDASILPEVLRRFVGEDGYKAVMEHLRGPNGRVKVTDAVPFINRLLGGADPNS